MGWRASIPHAWAHPMASPRGPASACRKIAESIHDTNSKLERLALRMSWGFPTPHPARAAIPNLTKAQTRMHICACAPPNCAFFVGVLFVASDALHRMGIVPMQWQGAEGSMATGLWRCRTSPPSSRRT